MQTQEKLLQLFDAVRSGNYQKRDEFFNTLWITFTGLAHNEQAQPMLQLFYTWADAHGAEHPDFLSRMLLTRGCIAFLADDFKSALDHLNRAHALFNEQNEPDGAAACFIFNGYVYRSTGEFDLALKYGLLGMDGLSRTEHFKMFRIIGAYWIGGLYADTDHLDEALDLFHEGLSVDFKPGIDALGARITNGIGGVYMKQKNYTLALENYQKALDLIDDATEFTFKARGLTDIGDYYYIMGDYGKAIQYNEESLSIRREMNIKNGSITNLMNLGDIYYKQGKFPEAITVLTDALKLAEEIKVKVKMYQIHQLLSDIYLGTGEIAESLAHYKAFHTIREDVNHEDLERKVKNQVQLFQAQLTEKENVIIKNQKLEIEKKNLELQETIDELTLAKISKRAKALTLTVAIVLFIFQDKILEIILELFASNNYFLAMTIKVLIIFSLNPVNKAIEHYMLKKVISRKKNAASV